MPKPVDPGVLDRPARCWCCCGQDGSPAYKVRFAWADSHLPADWVMLEHLWRHVGQSAAGHALHGQASAGVHHGADSQVCDLGHAPPLGVTGAEAGVEQHVGALQAAQAQNLSEACCMQGLHAAVQVMGTLLQVRSACRSTAVGAACRRQKQRISPTHRLRWQGAELAVRRRTLHG